MSSTDDRKRKEREETEEKGEIFSSFSEKSSKSLNHPQNSCKRKSDCESEDGNASKKTALDLEEILKKKQQEEEAKNKPIFISREEKQKLALARRAKEAEEKKEREDLERKQREKFFSSASNGSSVVASSSSASSSRSESRDSLRDSRDGRDERRRDDRRDDRDSRDGRDDRRGDDRRRDDRRDSRDDRRRDDRRDDRRDSRDDRSSRDDRRDSRDDRRGDDRKDGKEGRDKRKADAEELEKELIRKQYMGEKIEKKRIIKPSEKFKFIMDWNEEEDTSKDFNPLYVQKQELKPMFGRGTMGGVENNSLIKKDKRDNLDDPNSHWTKKSLKEMSDRDWRIFREDFNISTKGGNIPKPIRSWRESIINKKVVDAIEKVGYKEPTPIQRQAIPIGLTGRDILGIAETGSGKTAAFVVPMLDFILNLPKLTPETEQDGPYAVIMAPTRELATQIEKEVVKFAAFCGIRSVAVIGGLDIEQQAFELRKGCEVIIATPGRLKDCLDSRYVVLNQCMYVVLDEADRMIDMGFEPQVNAILDAMPSTHLKSESEDLAVRQENEKGRYRITTMYSATMPVGVERLTRKYLRRHATVIIGEVGKAVDRIEQRFEWVSEEAKNKRLFVALEQTKAPIIIFLNKKKGCDIVAKTIEKTTGYKTITLHSGKNQVQREAAIEGFKSARYDVLVATDVAGRGLDVKGVTHVINYDMAKSIDDYTHRIGRTGRAGLEGLATTFLTADDEGIFYDLKQMQAAHGSVNKLPQELLNHPAAQYKPGSVADKRSKTVIYAN